MTLPPNTQTPRYPCNKLQHSGPCTCLASCLLHWLWFYWEAALKITWKESEINSAVNGEWSCLAGEWPHAEQLSKNSEQHLNNNFFTFGFVKLGTEIYLHRTRIRRRKRTSCTQPVLFFNIYILKKKIKAKAYHKVYWFLLSRLT